MAKKDRTFNPRQYMEQALEVMLQSVSEPRDDKISPKVGAVLIKSDGTVETASRGELRYGDHAEFTLLERKNRGELLEGSLLFATLEPCAPGARKHPKLGCAERIVNARVKKVWVGIEDPDPTVDRKGIQYLLEHGIEVEMFDSDLQSRIREENKEFIEQAEERAKKLKDGGKKKVVLSKKEKAAPEVDLDDLSKEQLENFIEKAKLRTNVDSTTFHKKLRQLGLLSQKDGQFVPSGWGLLLFGENPQDTFHNALIRATLRRADGNDEIADFKGSLPKQIEAVTEWYAAKIGSYIDRSTAARRTVYDYPPDVFREAIINAVAHRDYDIEGAPIHLEINPDAIIIKSPGDPVPPLTLEEIKKFEASVLSRNPKVIYVFDQLELVEQRGMGFKTMRSLPKEHNLPLPVISYEAPYMVLSFPRTAEALRKVSPRAEVQELTEEELIGYEYIRERRELTRKNYEEHFGFDRKKAERHLTKMVELGLIQRIGAGPSTYYELIAT